MLRTLNLSAPLNSETIKTLLLLIGGGVVATALHWLIGVAQRSLVRRFVTGVPIEANTLPPLRTLFFAWAGNAVRTAAWLLYFALVVNLIPQTRDRFGSVGNKIGDLRDSVIIWFLKDGIYVAIVIIVTIFLMRFTSALIKTAFTLFERSAVTRDALASRRRLQTVSTIFRGTVQSIILFIGLMTLLPRLNVNVTPILASAGVVGIAVGFGAQSLIKDLFGGLLILLEDQYSVGDTIKIGEISGTVENLTLRVTRIRGIDGALTMIPNGSIGTVSNLSKDWSRVVLDIEVDYSEDVDRAMEILFETARKMKEENPQNVIEEPAMLGVDKMSSSGVTLRLMLKTSPAKHFEIGRELRRRIKLAFEREGIKSPMPQQQLILSNPPGGSK